MAFNGWSPGVRHRLSEYEEPADRQSDDQGDCGEPKKRRGKPQKPDHEHQLADGPTGRRLGGSAGRTVRSVATTGHFMQTTQAPRLRCPQRHCHST